MAEQTLFNQLNSKDEETARKFFEEDFEVLEIDWSIHDKIVYESTHIRIQRSERVEVNE